MAGPLDAESRIEVKAAFSGVRKGTNGVGTKMGPPRCLCFLTGGPFWVLPLTYLYRPIRSRADLFPQSVQSELLVRRPHWR